MVDKDSFLSLDPKDQPQTLPQVAGVLNDLSFIVFQTSLGML